MRALIAACVLRAVLCLDAGPVLAGLDVLPNGLGVEVSAAEIVYEVASDRYLARGDVRVVQGERVLIADEVRFDGRRRIGVARGNVRLMQGDAWVEAEGMRFSLDTLAGVLHGARLVAGPDQLRVRAASLERVAEGRYRLERGVLTSCRCPDEDSRLPWEIEAREADAELGGYATARDAKARVLGIPVLWLPWLAVPIKTERESGVLFPELAFGGRNGAQVGLPLFWAPRHDVGVTLTPRWVEQRGFKPDLEVEYLIGESSGGKLFATYVNDRQYSDGSQPPFEEHRYAVQLEHDQALPLGMRARADVKLVSDDLYLDDFDDAGRYRRDLFLRSKVFAGRPLGGAGTRAARGSVVAAVHWADGIRAPGQADLEGRLLLRLPELRGHWMSGPIPGLAGSGLRIALDGEYSYFYPHSDAGAVGAGAALGRDPFHFDTGLDPRPGQGGLGAGDGIYQEGEPLREGGHRLVFAPRIARPFSIGPLEVRPEAGYSQVVYGTDRLGVGERGVAYGRVDAALPVMGRLRLPGGRGIRHGLEPFVRWTGVWTRNQAANPVFVPPSSAPQVRLRSLAPESLFFDPADRIPDAQQLEVGVSNRFGRLQSSEWRLSYLVDYAEQGRDRLGLEIQTKVAEGLRLRAAAGFDPTRARFDDAWLEGSWSLPDLGPSAGNYATLRYRYLRDLPTLAPNVSAPVSQVDVGLGTRLFSRFVLRYGITYDVGSADRTPRRLTNGGLVAYLSRCRCWGVGLEVREEAGRDVFVGVRYTLLGLGDPRRNPLAGDAGLFGALSW